MKRKCAILLWLALLGTGLGTSVATAGDDARSWQEPATGMRFVAIPKGCYKMGAEHPQAPQPEPFWERVGYTGTASEDELPVHEVCLDAFWLGKFEVSRGEWRKVMGGAMPDDPRLPVAGVSWLEAREFAARLTELSAGKARFRLPTEAEWEYACRGGAVRDVDPFEGGVEVYAWHRFSNTAPQPVGQLRANKFGLHDMLGNVWEWVADGYQVNGYTRHGLYNPVVDAQTTPDLPQRVLRGGGFRTERVQVRCAMRGHAAPDSKLEILGLRLVRE